SSSWPDLFRPSTSLMLFGFQDVDARDKRGHDESITQGRWYKPPPPDDFGPAPAIPEPPFDLTAASNPKGAGHEQAYHRAGPDGCRGHCVLHRADIDRARPLAEGADARQFAQDVGTPRGPRGPRRRRHGRYHDQGAQRSRILQAVGGDLIPAAAAGCRFPLAADRNRSAWSATPLRRRPSPGVRSRDRRRR